MSISGVGSLAGQVAQEGTVSLCGRFVNLFQNRIAAVAAISLTSTVGFIGGVFVAVNFVKVVGKKDSIVLIYITAFLTALNVMVAKCLKLPLSPLAVGGIAVGSAALTFAGLCVLSKSKKTNRL